MIKKPAIGRQHLGEASRVTRGPATGVIEHIGLNYVGAGLTNR